MSDLIDERKYTAKQSKAKQSKAKQSKAKQLMKMLSIEQ